MNLIDFLKQIYRIGIGEQLTGEEMRIASKGYYKDGTQVIWHTGNRFVARVEGNEGIEIKFYNNSGRLQSKDRLDDNTLA
ncbi:MAG: hypothetical protein AABY22_34855 [Nanoarchaeota archaeon]